MTAQQPLEVMLQAQLNPRYRTDADVDLLRKLIQAALAVEGMFGTVEVSLVVAGDATLRRLNRDFRGIDRTTDVLSFPLLSSEETRVESNAFVSPPGEPLRLGDIVISMPAAKRQAVQSGHSLSRELGYLAVHGALHLLGYDHETELDRKAMRQKEEAALHQMGLER